MFKILKKRKQVSVNNGIQERIAKTIVSRFIQLQGNWSVFMQRLTERLSIRSKKLGITLFCLVAGGYSFYTLMDGFSSQRKKPFELATIKTPGYVVRDDEEKLNAFTIIPEKEYRKIHEFRKYMDSLARSDTGKLIADSILHARRGLMDSIIQIEHIYQLQKASKK